MDEFESDTQNLIEFINNKCNDIEEIDYKKIVFMYSKCIRTALISVYTEQNNIYYSSSCADLISEIFKITYNYSFNLKLSLFICERSILLFNEYLNISKNYSSEQINLLDVKQFIINKSIGPIINKNKNNLSLIKVDNLLCFIKSMLFKFLDIKINNKIYYIYSDEEFIESINNILINSLTNVYLLGYINYIEKQIKYILEKDIDIIPKEINILKIKLELFLYLHNKIGLNYQKTKENLEEIINTNLNLINNEPNIIEFFDSQPLIEKNLYKILIKHCDNIKL